MNPEHDGTSSEDRKTPTLNQTKSFRTRTSIVLNNFNDLTSETTSTSGRDGDGVISFEPSNKIETTVGDPSEEIASIMLPPRASNPYSNSFIGQDHPVLIRKNSTFQFPHQRPSSKRNLIQIGIKSMPILVLTSLLTVAFLYKTSGMIDQFSQGLQISRVYLGYILSDWLLTIGVQTMLIESPHCNTKDSNYYYIATYSIITLGVTAFTSFILKEFLLNLHDDKLYLLFIALGIRIITSQIVYFILKYLLKKEKKDSSTSSLQLVASLVSYFIIFLNTFITIFKEMNCSNNDKSSLPVWSLDVIFGILFPSLKILFFHPFVFITTFLMDHHNIDDDRNLVQFVAFCNLALSLSILFAIALSSSSNISFFIQYLLYCTLSKFGWFLHHPMYDHRRERYHKLLVNIYNCFGKKKENVIPSSSSSQRGSERRKEQSKSSEKNEEVVNENQSSKGGERRDSLLDEGPKRSSYTLKSKKRKKTFNELERKTNETMFKATDLISREIGEIWSFELVTMASHPIVQQCLFYTSSLRSNKLSSLSTNDWVICLLVFGIIIPLLQSFIGQALISAHHIELTHEGFNMNLIRDALGISFISTGLLICLAIGRF